MRISNSRRHAKRICARTRLLDLGLGTNGRFAVHPVTSKNVSWRMWVFVLDQELPPNQNVYILIDAKTVLDSCGKPFVGLYVSVRVAIWANMKGNLDFICATNCSLDDIREVFANNRRWQGARAGQVSFPSGPTGMDPSQTSFFQLLSIGTKMVGPGASEIVLDLATVALVDGVSVFFFSVIFQEGGHIPSCLQHRCVHIEPHQWRCLGQPSNFQRRCPGLGRTDRGPLVS